MFPKWLLGFLVFCVAFVLSVPPPAGGYRLEPLFNDVNPHDGIHDPGSLSNPYILKDFHGREIGRIRTPYHKQICPQQPNLQLYPFPWRKIK